MPFKVKSLFENTILANKADSGFAVISWIVFLSVFQPHQCPLTNMLFLDSGHMHHYLEKSIKSNFNVPLCRSCRRTPCRLSEPAL